MTENEEPSANTLYIFNGDFGDRGPQSLETYLCLLALKILHPTAVFLNRGNHESNYAAERYGLQREISDRLGELPFTKFSELFKALPLACLVEAHDAQRAFIVHGHIPVHGAETVILADIDE